MIAAVLMLLVSLEGQTPQHRRFMQPSLGRSVGAVFPGSICLPCNDASHRNFLLQSNTFTTSPWAGASVSSTDPIIEPSDGGMEFFDPAGGFTATKVSFGTCASGGQQSQLQALVETGVSGEATANIYARSPDGGSLSVAVFTTPDNAATGITSVLGLGWAPYRVTRTAGSATDYMVVGCMNSATYTGTTGAPAATVYLYGAQLALSSATSCTQPTTGAASTGTGTYPVCQGNFITAPYKPSIAWVGDSITYGYVSPGVRLSTPPPAQVALSLTRTIDNFGVPADTSAQCLAHWRSSIRGRGYTSLIMLCGVNSTPLGGATAFASLQTLLDEARADGMRITIVGLTPWGNASTWSVGNQTATDYINTQLSAYATTYGLQFVSTASLGIGSPLALTGANDSGDGIHPSQAGADALAALVAAASP